MSYPTETYTNKNGASVQVHVVTADEDGQTVTLVPGNQTADVREGDILIAGYRPDQWDKAPIDFADEYTAGDGVAERKAAAEPDVFEPSDQTAAEVRAYLSRTDLTDSERERVETAERDGKNRSSAFPA